MNETIKQVEDEINRITKEIKTCDSSERIKELQNERDEWSMILGIMLNKQNT